MVLRPARPEEAGALSDLALAAKGHWGYGQEFLAACRDELTFRPEDVARGRFVVADHDGLVVGFASIGGEAPGGELENLWVTPSRIGTGLGRVLWLDALARAATAGFEYLTIDADPNAEGFYRRMGAERVGEVPSSSVAGRMLPRMRVRVSPAPSGGNRSTCRPSHHAERSCDPVR
ncbi:GNAT family N-acetyltransferase [Actinoalloteichus sp. AHMU CJ021]|nr:GNAT family N-acetyltransferase [Actinoalloteichus sp. AHMU CJ021]